jgi:methionyl-tRNA formyltransferase
MRLVFAGTPAFARCALEALLEAGHDIPLVVTQPDRFGKVLVQVQTACDGSRYLRNLQCVRKPRDEVIASWCDKDLGLVL